MNPEGLAKLSDLVWATQSAQTRDGRHVVILLILRCSWQAQGAFVTPSGGRVLDRMRLSYWGHCGTQRHVCIGIVLLIRSSGVMTELSPSTLGLTNVYGNGFDAGPPHVGAGS